uniref:CD9 antigen-like n=1 Tax=Myxine glutinosa TaxID=7769 RepID=UPI00358F4CB1
MGIQGCFKCVKTLLFIFNFIFWLAGAAVLGIGLWLRFDNQTKDMFNLDKAPSTFYIGVYILIGIGALMMLMGFLGCCGAIQESQCMLGSFFICLLVVFAAEIAAGIWAVLHKEQIPKELKVFYDASFVEYQKTKTDSSKMTLFTLHKALDCCGTNLVTGAIAALGSDVCPSKGFVDSLTNPTKDCHTSIDEILTSKVYIIAAVGIGIGVIMIFGMIFSMALCCAIRNNRQYI